MRVSRPPGPRGSTVTQQHGALIVSLAERQRLPTICRSREYVEAGGSMSYGVIRRAVGMVGEIFKGAKPSGLPRADESHALLRKLPTAASMG